MMRQTVYVYVASSSDIGTAGIYVYKLDIKSGALHLLSEVTDISRCQYLNIHPSGNYLYANGPVIEPHINVFKIGTDGGLIFLNRQPTNGLSSCYVSIDKPSKIALVVNYTGEDHIGSIAVFPLQEDGQAHPVSHQLKLDGKSIHPQRQNGSHPHMITITPDNRFVLVPDLGTDRVMVYQINYDTNQLIPHSTPYIPIEAGSGPRHLAIHPTLPYLYVLSELQPTLTAVHYNSEKGLFETIKTYPTLPRNYKAELKSVAVNPANGTLFPSFANLPEYIEFKKIHLGADIHVTPSGRFLYASSRGHNSLATYEIDLQTAVLTYLGNQSTLGEWPRAFGIDPTGKILIVANRWTHDLFTFFIDPENGKLTSTGTRVDVPEPICVKFL